MLLMRRILTPMSASNTSSAMSAYPRFQQRPHGRALRARLAFIINSASMACFNGLCVDRACKRDTGRVPVAIREVHS